jgi:hypothetical protein
MPMVCFAKIGGDPSTRQDLYTRCEASHSWPARDQPGRNPKSQPHRWVAAPEPDAASKSGRPFASLWTWISGLEDGCEEPPPILEMWSVRSELEERSRPRFQRRRSSVEPARQRPRHQQPSLRSLLQWVLVLRVREAAGLLVVRLECAEDAHANVSLTGNRRSQSFASTGKLSSLRYSALAP